MTREQKELLYEIASWHSKDFYNRMVDRWSERNYQVDAECNEAIRRLEKEYKEQYGDLPKWQYIDDVWNAMNQLKKDLQEN